METYDIPEQEYVVFECTLPTIKQVYEKINNEYLPNSEFNRTNTPEFEFYDKNFDPMNPDSKLYLYIPVQKK